MPCKAVLKQRGYSFANLCRVRRNFDPGGLQGLDLVCGGAFTASNDSPGMAHSFSGRGGFARDEGSHGFMLHVFFDEAGSVLLRYHRD